MKILSIVETPYRGTVEEQDDAAFWFTHAVKNSVGEGAEFNILLQGDAVSYAVRDQNPEGLTIGGVALDRPCKPHEDIQNMSSAGMTVHVLREDVLALGIPLERLVSEVELVGREQLPALAAQHDQVWHF